MDAITDFVTGNPWLVLALSASAATLLAWLLQRMLLRLLRRALRANAGGALVLRASEGALGVVMVLFALQLVFQGAPDDLAFVDALRRLAGLLLILMLSIPTTSRTTTAPAASSPRAG